jgi:PEP-CTERM motif
MMKSVRLPLALLLTGLSQSLSGIAFASTQIVSQVQVNEVDDDSVNFVRDTSLLANTQAEVTSGGATGKVVTDFGVNKLFLQSDGTGGSSHATSLWSDVFTASGNGPVTVNMSLRVDGSAVFPADDDDPVDFNYFFKAIRGAYGFNGQGDDDFGDFSEVFIEQTGDLTRRMFVDGDDTVYVYDQSNASVESQSIGEGYYEVVRPNGDISRYYSDRVVNPQNGFTIVYADAPSVREYYERLVSQYLLLDSDFMCPLETDCLAGLFDKTLSLSFTVNAGEMFSVIGAMMVEDFKQGSIDFFSTARLTGITVSNGATLSSASGRLQFANGAYSFGAFPSAVPEPGTWMMMIAGFGLVGASMRMQRRKQLAAA